MKKLDGKVLEEIKGGLEKEHVGGTIVIKKSEVEGRSQRLVEGIIDYLGSVGYDTTIMEDKKECHVLYVLNSF